jgi:thymidylate synthase ThyX
MRIISPDVEIITEENPLKRIELCGRVCYKSEGRITESSAAGFVARLMESGHTSVLEHARLLVKGEKQTAVRRRLCSCMSHRAFAVMSRIRDLEGGMTINARDYFFLYPETEASEFASMSNADDYLTVRFTCDRAIANELVRHRVFSFSQESTRYVNYKGGLTFINPVPYEDNTLWFASMELAEKAYLAMIEAGCAPQEARNVLPLSTKTELVMTGTYLQWKELLKLRCASGAHPQMRYLMDKLKSHKDLPFEMQEVKKHE